MIEDGLLVLAGGGTGGHLFPGLAVARAFKQRFPQGRVLFLATQRPIDDTILGPSGWDYQAQPVQPLPRRPDQFISFLRGWQDSMAMCRKILADPKLFAVLGLGGFASGPAIKAARGRHVSIGLLNPDAVPGRANRFAMGKVDVIFAQWEQSTEHFGRHARKCRVTGCPIRSEIITTTRQDGCRELGLDPQKQTLVIMGGSQGGHNVNEAAVWSLTHAGESLSPLHDLLAGWQIIHITGAADREQVQQRYATAKLEVQVLPFTERMGAVMATADLVVNRAGASTLAEITASGTPSILLPYPYHKDQHQLRNAEILREVGAAMIVKDQCVAERTGVTLRAALGRCLTEPDRLAQMARGAQTLARPDAAVDVVRFLAEAR